MFIDYGDCFFEVCITFLVPRPHQIPIGILSVFVFNKIVWISFFSCFIIEFLILLLFYKNYNSSDIFTQLISLLTTGNTISIPIQHGSIYIFITWSIFSLFFASIYSSEVTTYLEIPTYNRRIDTAKDFVKSNLTWGTFRPVGFQFFNPDFVDEMIIKSRYRFHNLSETQQVIDEIKNDRYAVLVTQYDLKWATILQGLDDTPYRNMRIMKECFFKPNIAQAFPLNSPFRKTFNYYMMELFELGIFDYIKQSTKMLTTPMDMESIFLELDKYTGNRVVLTVHHFLGAFILLGIGLVMSGIVFICELIYT